MDPKVLTGLAAQAELEAKAAQFYANAANWANRAGYPGTADYCHASEKEERKHLKRVQHFLRDNADVMPTTPAVPALNKEWASLLAFWKDVVALEESVTAHLEQVSDAGPRRVSVLVEDLIEIQNEDLRQLRDYVRWLEKAGENEAAVQAIDRRIGKAA